MQPTLHATVKTGATSPRFFVASPTGVAMYIVPAMEQSFPAVQDFISSLQHA
jgi:hypothetical protein